MANGARFSMDALKGMAQECLQCGEYWSGGGTCPICGGHGQGNAVAAIQARTMDKETEWPTPRAMTRGNGTETRSRTNKRTKAEIMALDKAKRENPGCDVIEQPFKLPLTDGGTYQPDILIRNPKIPGMRVIEVKGGYRGPGWEQGIERYKRAKYEWKPWIGFALWTYDNKNKAWRVE